MRGPAAGKETQREARRGDVFGSKKHVGGSSRCEVFGFRVQVLGFWALGFRGEGV